MRGLEKEHLLTPHVSGTQGSSQKNSNISKISIDCFLKEIQDGFHIREDHLFNQNSGLWKALYLNQSRVQKK